MSWRASEETPCSGEKNGSLSSFLRSLLSGIPWSESAHAEARFEIDPPTKGLIDIHNANGRIEVIGEDRANIAVVARKHARAESEQAAHQLVDCIRVDTSEVAGNLELDVAVPRKWNRHGSADLEVRVPRQLRVRAVSANGKLCVAGLRCAVQVRSSNGSVQIRDVEGDVEINTSNAKVCCTGTNGRLVVRSSNGKIEIEQHRGGLDASTSNGLIQASLEQLAKEGVTLATSNGRIVLELPNDPDAEIDIRVDNGVIRSEIPLGPEGRELYGRVRTRLGRGGPPIRLRTSNGTISLR